MNTHSAPTPGLTYGLYPEQKVTEPSIPKRIENRISRSFAMLKGSNERSYFKFALRVQGLAEQSQILSDDELSLQLKDLSIQLASNDQNTNLLASTLALTCESIRRETGMMPYPSQIMAARVMLDGNLAEMHTGEGKTLAIALAALTTALSGIPLQIVTANDYLVLRDAETLTPIAHRLGLSVGAVTADMDADKRRHQYSRTITFCSAKELGFDYLKDQLLPTQGHSDLHMRASKLGMNKRPSSILPGLCFALIDEADSVLLDEANTPLVLSKEYDNSAQEQSLLEATELCKYLETPLHYSVDMKQRSIKLTDDGEAYIQDFSSNWKGLWNTRRFREGLVKQALSAQHCYTQDHDYLVREGAVHIIDPTTGRLAEGRQWSQGMHQLIEIKEGCELSKQYETIAQITFQNFFPRFLKLAGTSATLAESSKELASTYDLKIFSIPRHRPSQRKELGTQVFRKSQDKWGAVVNKTKSLRKHNRAILIGTDSVSDTMELSALFKQSAIPHRVLNASQDSEEAEIIAQAGECGRVTVTTNMAGRGTDIPISKNLMDKGGLHVISCQYNKSRRIDKQLHGRCGRQGNPGSVETVLSLEDPLIKQYLPEMFKKWATHDNRKAKPLPAWLSNRMINFPQRLEQQKQLRQREQLKKSDIQNRKWLAVAGAGN